METADGVVSAVSYLQEYAGPADFGWSRTMDLSAWNPQARLAAQDKNCVLAEVVYPGPIGRQSLYMANPADQRAYVRIYNNWLSTLCAVAPDRFLGVGVLPLHGPVEWALAEAERIIDKGLRSVLVPVALLNRSDYGPVWAVLQDCEMPVACLVSSGSMPGVEVLQQYPQLRIVLVGDGNPGDSTDIARLFYYLSSSYAGPLWVAVAGDGIRRCSPALFDRTRLMWGIGRPSIASSLPRVHDQIAQDFRGLPRAVVHKITADNAIQLYGIV